MTDTKAPAPTVTCSHCGKAFASIMKLMQHFQKAHGSSK